MTRMHTTLLRDRTSRTLHALQAVLTGPNIGEKHIQPFGYDRLAEAFRLFPGDVVDKYDATHLASPGHRIASL
jgi:hypothetical protein